MSKPQPFGEASPSSKYSDADVSVIRKNYRRFLLFRSKISPRAMSDNLKIPYDSLMKILTNQSRREGK